MEPVILYLTAKDKPQAEALARALLEARLIACANMWQSQSLFRWENAVQEAHEWVLVAKSQAQQVEHITRMVKELHSYDCPCVVALPITAGNPDFLQWIAQETTPAP